MKILSLFILIYLIAPVGVVAEPKPLKQVEAVVTAYTSLPELTDSTPFHTANGERTHIGGLACPRKYPFGTIIYGLGEPMICNDRMNRRYEGNIEHFDVWLKTLDDAKKFGRKKVILYIYEI